MAEHGVEKRAYRKGGGRKSSAIGTPSWGNRLWVIAHKGAHPTHCAYCGDYVKKHSNLELREVEDIPIGWKFPRTRGKQATRLYNNWKGSSCFQIPGTGQS